MQKIIYHLRNKSIFFIQLLLLCFPFVMEAQTEKIVLHMKDGRTVEYAMDEVDYVELVAPEGSGSQETVPEVGGTIAEGVDMGLSVLWAEHNLGAADATDLGGRFTFDTSDIDAWGDGWRLPTDEEWEELYSKCEWKWVVRNGISGRLITGSTGNAIFIPAAGIAFDEDVFINGCVGVYWTADSYDDEVTEAPAEATGAYFDSANIYRMEYPKTNRFSVRLVK